MYIFSVGFLKKMGPTSAYNVALASALFLFASRCVLLCTQELSSVALREAFLLNSTPSFGNVTFCNNVCRMVEGTIINHDMM